MASVKDSEGTSNFTLADAGLRSTLLSPSLTEARRASGQADNNHANATSRTPAAISSASADRCQARKQKEQVLFQRSC